MSPERSSAPLDLQFRTTKNYRSAQYLGPRVGANIAFTVLVIRLAYYGQQPHCTWGSWCHTAMCLTLPPPVLQSVLGHWR